jgi:hypothetical protein
VRSRPSAACPRASAHARVAMEAAKEPQARTAAATAAATKGVGAGGAGGDAGGGEAIDTRAATARAAAGRAATARAAAARAAAARAAARPGRRLRGHVHTRLSTWTWAGAVPLGSSSFAPFQSSPRCCRHVGADRSAAVAPPQRAELLGRGDRRAARSGRNGHSSGRRPGQGLSERRRRSAPRARVEVPAATDRASRAISRAQEGARLEFGLSRLLRTPQEAVGLRLRAALGIAPPRALHERSSAPPSLHLPPW